jgi:hypothetical protein
MTVHIALKLAGLLLMLLGVAHTLFGRYFRWDTELASLSLFTRQVFQVHCFFIALTVGLMGGCTLFYTDALIHSGTLSQIVLAGFALFWFVRLVFQLFVYDPEIWRGRPLYTFMHGLFSLLWVYLVVTYGCALWQACRNSQPV